MICHFLGGRVAVNVLGTNLIFILYPRIRVCSKGIILLIENNYSIGNVQTRYWI